MRFTGKTVVVLGGNSGIGLAAARAFQAEGARVAITGRDEATLSQVAAASGMLAVRADISCVAESRAAIGRIAAQLGSFDVLFANAGIGGFAAVPEVTEELWDRVHGVNLRGAFFALQAALPHLRDGGSIVITSSVAANGGFPGIRGLCGRQGRAARRGARARRGAPAPQDPRERGLPGADGDGDLQARR